MKNNDKRKRYTWCGSSHYKEHIEELRAAHEEFLKSEFKKELDLKIKAEEALKGKTVSVKRIRLRISKAEMVLLRKKRERTPKFVILRIFGKASNPIPYDKYLSYGQDFTVLSYIY